MPVRIILKSPKGSKLIPRIDNPSVMCYHQINGGEIMQIILHLKTKGGLKLPLAYSYQFSSAVYSLLSAGSSGLAETLHDEGFASGTGRHKLFVISQLSGVSRIEKDGLAFGDHISFEVRSVLPEIIYCLRDAAFERGCLRLFSHELEIRMIEVYDRHLLMQQAEVKTLSPIAAAVSRDGKTIYYSPEDEGFEQAVNVNLYHKYTAVFGTEPPSVLSVSPLAAPKKVVTKFKGIWITAYHSRLMLSSHPDVIDLLYNTGLGSKNSQGFGMFEPV